MEYYKNTLCIEAGWLVEQGILTNSIYRHLTERNNRNKLNVLRRGCRNTPALVAYESIPERFKRAIKERIGIDPYTAAKVNAVESLIVGSDAASDFFETHKLSDGRKLPKEKRREYYANAIILDAITVLLNNKKAKRSAMGGKAIRGWEAITEAVQELDKTKYPHSLPGNARRLEERYKGYKAEGLSFLIHKNYQNKNSAKVDDEIKESFMIELLADPRNLDNVQVRDIYNMLAEKMEWKKITAGAVAVWRDKYGTQILPGRRGVTEFRNRSTMQVKRSAPTKPLYYLTMDGWDVELLYQKTETNAKGHSVTTYHNRPTVVVVLDPSVKYIIGYAIGTHETPGLIQEALQNACRHTVELFGSMYRAHQIQSDRYAIKSMTPFYESVAKLSTPARAKNAKAKVIEPYFKSLNKTYCQLKGNWSGYGITSGKDMQPNVEHLNKYRHSFPDYEGVCAQVREMVELKRAEKKAEYLQRWAEMEQADKLEFSRERYLMTFGQKTGYKNMMTGSGLHVTIEGVKYDYDCFDTSFRNHSSKRWEVRYDIYDLSTVLAVSEDESLQFLLEEKFVQPMALRDRQNGDSEQLVRIAQHNRKLETEITDLRTRTSEAVQMALLTMPQLQNDTLKKLLLTDSNGQHKDRRNDDRAELTGETTPKSPRKLKTREVEDVEEMPIKRQSHVDLY